MIVWPWQKGGNVLCPEGGKHDWEVTRSLFATDIEREARIADNGHVGRVMVLDDGTRYEDRCCLKCGKIERKAEEAIEAARSKLRERETRKQRAAQIMQEAVS